MSVFKTASVLKRNTAATAQSVLITEGQVRLGTTAALSRPRRQTRAEHRSHRDHPSRLRYLEYSTMSREMDRL